MYNTGAPGEAAHIQCQGMALLSAFPQVDCVYVVGAILLLTAGLIILHLVVVLSLVPILWHLH